MMPTLLLIWSLGLLPIPALSASGSTGAEQLLHRMQTAAEGVRDYTTVLIKEEQIEGRLLPRTTLLAKWARPYKLYLKNIEEPGKGREIIYVRGGEVHAHRGSFPDITVRLDPRGSRVMEENHHAADQASLLDLVGLLTDNLALLLERREGQVRIAGREVLWGRPCLLLEMRTSPGGWQHVMKDGETLWDVARQHNRDMYQILHHNAGQRWTSPDDPAPGDTVFVPRYYGSRMEIWIDEALGLPVKAEVFDHFGQLYERYEHRGLKVNVGLGDRDFDPQNPGYGF